MSLIGDYEEISYYLAKMGSWRNSVHVYTEQQQI